MEGEKEVEELPEFTSCFLIFPFSSIVSKTEEEVKGEEELADFASCIHVLFPSSSFGSRDEEDKME